MSSPIDWQRFADVIHASTNVLLTVHHRPDGDCLGSALAMRLVLQRLGKNVKIITPHKVPPTLAFLDTENVIVPLEYATQEDKQWFQRADLLFALDTSSRQQLGDLAAYFEKSPAKKIALDHHAKGNDLEAEKFIAPDAEATGMLVVQAAAALGVPLERAAAEAAFVAVATDTGWFRFQNVDGGTFRTAASLLDAGAVPADIYRELYEQESLGRVRLIGRVLAKVEPLFGNAMMFTSVLQSDLEAAGALPSDTEDIVNMLLTVKGTLFAVLMSELKDGSFKFSFRSRCAVDCSELATLFGGGGHKAAAGATLYEPFDEARQRVLEAVGKALAAAVR